MQTLSSLIADYLEVGEYEKRLSPDTIKAYRIDLRQFLEFTCSVWPGRDVLNQYIKHINQTYAPRSAKRKLASERAFYHEMELSGKLDENPFDKLHIRIQSPKQLPRIIPEQTVQTLLQSAYDSYISGCRETLRDIVVLELLFSTGLRVSELCALSKENFQLSDSELRLLINGKGRKERVTQITTVEVLHLLKIYCSEFPKEIEEQSSILLNRRRRPISPQSVRRIINKYLKQIGVNNHITPHMFRPPYVKYATTFFAKFFIILAGLFSARGVCAVFFEILRLLHNLFKYLFIPLRRVSVREIRRRTRVVGAFPDGNSALMLVCAQLRHVAGTQWGNKKCINMKHLEAAFEDVATVG